MSSPASLQYNGLASFQCSGLALIGNYIEHAPEASILIIMLMRSFFKCVMTVPYNLAENVFFATTGEQSEYVRFTESWAGLRWPMGTSLTGMTPLSHDSEVPWPAMGLLGGSCEKRMHCRCSGPYGTTGTCKTNMLSGLVWHSLFEWWNFYHPNKHAVDSGWKAGPNL